MKKNIYAQELLGEKTRADSTYLIERFSGLLLAQKRTDRLLEEIMLPETQEKAYSDFYDSARQNDILEPKTTLMVHMTAAMALGCYP